MKRLLPAWSLLLVAGVTFVWLMATPVPVAAQGVVSSSGGGASGGGSGGSVSSGGSSGGSVSSGGSSGGGSVSSGGSSGGSSSGGGGGSVSSGGGSSGSAPGRSGATGGSGYSAPRGSGSSGSSGRATGRSRDGSGKPGDGDKGTPPGGARDREGRDPVGNAVPRGSVPVNRGGAPVFVPGAYYGGYYDPWWYGAGYSGFYGGFYDPWYGGYPTTYSQYSSTYQEEGKLRLKIKPREAEVYVDGYFVGLIDDFDGVFQRLHIETGSHRIEVRAPGYEPLVIDVRISAEHTTTYQGELKRIQ